jgi:hypothetical protein
MSTINICYVKLFIIVALTSFPLNVMWVTYNLLLNYMRNLQFFVWMKNDMYSIILYNAFAFLVGYGCKTKW